MRRSFVSVFAAISFACAAAAQMPTLSAPAKRVLPDDVRPLFYRFTVAPDAATELIDGEASIDIEVVRPAARIVLNATELEFSSVKLDGREAVDVSVDREARQAAFAFGGELQPGRYTLSISYRGHVVDGIGGLFAMDYRDGGAVKSMLATQLEPGTARRVAPMWDQPDVKAPIELTLIVPADQEAVSNMPAVETTSEPGGRKRIRFAPTPPMSSYLMFIAIGDLERVTAMAGDTEIGLVARRGRAGDGAFAMQSSIDLLAYYEDYFGVPYPLPKLDNIAGPSDSTDFSAMENWGASFYFEPYLLIGPGEDTIDRRYSVFITVAHELAHQWFGNLVTMKWWDDLWLNEGFATWMQTKAVAKLHPEWDVGPILVAIQQEAMAGDVKFNAQPIVRPVAGPAQAPLDGLTYYKGRSVVGMLEAYLGEEVFRDGVRAYIAVKSGGNATSADLWAALEAASGQPAGAIGVDFTTQAGVPLIRVDKVSCIDGVSHVALAQERFAAHRGGSREGNWHVPVTLRVVGGGEAKGIIMGRGEITAAGCGPVKVNDGQDGYYRTLYAPEALAALLPVAASFSRAERAGLAYDADALAAAGYIDAATRDAIKAAVQP